MLPNKFVLPLVPDFQASSIKFTQPIGVVRLEVIEARHLKKSDVGMLGWFEGVLDGEVVVDASNSTFYVGLGKSDPYVNIIVGSQEFRTATIYNTGNFSFLSVLPFQCPTLVLLHLFFAFCGVFSNHHQ